MDYEENRDFSTPLTRANSVLTGNRPPIEYFPKGLSMWKVCESRNNRWVRRFGVSILSSASCGPCWSAALPVAPQSPGVVELAQTVKEIGDRIQRIESKHRFGLRRTVQNDRGIACEGGNHPVGSYRQRRGSRKYIVRADAAGLVEQEQLLECYRIPMDMPNDYARRLEFLLGSLRKTFKGLDVSFGACHLGIEGEAFAVHDAWLNDDDGSVSCDQCKGIPDKQFFIKAKTDNSADVWVFLPPCSVESYHFPRGYKLLAGPDAPSLFVIGRVDRPALLRQGLDGFYRVLQKMEWTAEA